MALEDREENIHPKESKEFNINPYSTWLNPGTREFEQVKEWILTSLGWPI